MSKPKDRADFQIVDWTPLVVGKEPIGSFKNDIDSSSGWTSDKGYPFDIVIALDHQVNIYKIKIGMSDECIPHKIDVRIGIGRGGGKAYEDAKQANYSKKGTLEFVKRHRKDKTYEAKTLFIDAIGDFLWLVIYEPYPDSSNPHNQIRIRELEVYGYVEKKTEKLHDKKDSSREDELAPATPLPESSKKKKVKKKRKEESSSSSPNRYSHDGDGLVSRGDMIASEPLTSVRLIKNILQKKREKALQDDREVEATVCLRAIERLDEYEERIASLKTKMSHALQNHDNEYAERYRLAMADCRDTVFRAIHLDLLLDKHELRSLGMESKWSSS